MPTHVVPGVISVLCKKAEMILRRQKADAGPVHKKLGQKAEERTLMSTLTEAPDSGKGIELPAKIVGISRGTPGSRKSLLQQAFRPATESSQYRDVREVIRSRMTVEVKDSGKQAGGRLICPPFHPRPASL